MTSFVVKFTCNKIGYSNVFEWAEYNPKQPIGTKDIKFLSQKSGTFKGMMIDITEAEREIKKRMLACHKSQDVEKYYQQGEAIRKVVLSNLDLELYQHCQLPKSILTAIVKKFNIDLKKQKAEAVLEASDWKGEIKC